MSMTDTDARRAERFDEDRASLEPSAFEAGDEAGAARAQTEKETPRPDLAAARLAEDSRPRNTSPIVPKSTIASRALVAVIAIMTFLASLTTGGVILVRAAAMAWEADVSREVTIQVRPAEGRDIEADVSKAAGIAGQSPGITEVRPYSRAESMELLQPWLGSGLALDDLPVPRLVVVRTGSASTADLAQLRERLRAEVPTASLDDHRSFLARMRTMARAALACGIGVLALVLIATILSVTFATNGAMASNQPVIEVLHFVGAQNSFISGHFQRHFLRLGLHGAALGGGVAIALFALVELAERWYPNNPGSEQAAALFGSLALGPWGYGVVVVQALLIALVTAAASRHTVNRTLEAMR